MTLVSFVRSVQLFTDRIFIFHSCEQNVTQTTQFVKMDFNVPVFILARSVTADRRMTSQLKWDGGLGARESAISASQ